MLYLYFTKQGSQKAVAYLKTSSAHCVSSLLIVKLFEATQTYKAPNPSQLIKVI